MNFTRALTLVEMLLALALSAVVVMASTSWIQISAQFAAANASPEEATADAVLRLIRDDLQTFDRPLEEESASDALTWQGRIKIGPDSLSMRTRESGLSPVVHLYALHDGILTRETTTVPGESSKSRMLMDGVKRFLCEIDTVNEILTVRLICRSHHSTVAQMNDKNADAITLSRRFDLQ